MDINWVIKTVLFIAIMAFVLVALAMGLMGSRARALRNPELEAKCESAGLRVATSRLGGPVVSGTLHGTPFVMTATPGAKGTPPMTVIRVPTGLGSNFAITREASRDLSGGDLVESMFPDIKAREAVRALFGFGFDIVALSGRDLSAIRHFKAEVLHPDVLSAAVEQLAVIGATSGVQAVPTWLVPSESSDRIGVVSIALLPAGMFLFALGSAHGTAVLRDAWPGIVAAYLVLAALAVFYLRGRPLAGGEIGFVVFMGLPGLFLGGCGVAMMAS